MFSWLTSDPGREELLCILQHLSLSSSALGLQDITVGMEPPISQCKWLKILICMWWGLT